MEQYILKTFKKLKKEIPRKLKELKTFCDDNISELSELDPTHGSKNEDAWKYFEPLKLACESRQPRLMEIALDALHFLIEHGYIRSRLLENNAANPIDAIINCVSACADEYDEAVQLQVIKVLLTIVTSAHCEVHEGNLLLAVRSCFHIHLISKNQINKTTARAALTQMLSVINQRMEIYVPEAKSKDSADLHEVVQEVGVVIEENHQPFAPPSEEVNTDVGDTSVKVSEAMEESSAAIEENAVNGQVPKEEELSSPTKKAQDETASQFGISPQRAVSASDVHEVYAVNKTPSDAELAMSVSDYDTSVMSNPLVSDTATEATFLSIYHKDAFLTFRAICRISMKGLNDDPNAQLDPIALQNKILSLELILHILQHSGTVFQNDEKIISVVKDFLCVSLLSNCTSHIAQITGLSLQVFVSLLQKFKEHLKSEVEVFITGIFIRILESENSSFDHKLRVLEVFHIICKDPAGLVELFINYDCDLDAIDIFRRIVDGFAKIAKNSTSSQNRSSIDFISSTGKKGFQDELYVRHMGLEGLVIILRALQDLSESNKLNEVSSSSQLDTQVVLEEEELPKESLPTNNVDSVVDVFDKKQKMHEEMETGILKFNLSPKKGLSYLANLGHLEYTPESVAKFLIHHQDRLDKAAIGEFLGREREYENGFCTKVLHEYVDSMNFSNMPFDLAIRHFLGGFRIPGEAQKIDRIMEKFAERYYLQNRHVFASADMAFILAFSTIMLQTNLHNPAIRDDKRMTKEQFLKQNKGISSDGEIPDEMLSEIYDRIAAEPIRIMHDDKVNKKPKKEEPNFTVFSGSQDKKRKDAYNCERIEMVRASEALFRQRQRRNTQYLKTVISSHEMYIRPMFEMIWAPILAVLSQVLEICDDEAMVSLCLTGFRLAIHLSCVYEIPVARDTYINSLSKFTTLETIKEMQEKNIACIQALLDIAVSERDSINESWQQILRCISQLARLQLFASGVHTDEMFFSDTASIVSSEHSLPAGKLSRRASRSRPYNASSASSSGISIDPFRFFSGPSKAEAARIVEETNAELIVKEINTEIIDQIFFNSQYLSEKSVWFFVKSLCEVSMLEIHASNMMNHLRGKDLTIETMTPRVFSLQKLVEVADLNMHSRPRIAWANIWNFLTKYFTTIGASDNVALSMYAIDSLKQLAIKFLQKEELSNFNFQRVFLKPFEVVISKSKSLEIKDLILGCIDMMIRTSAGNIRSGWRSIFTILEVASTQDSVEISNIAFDIIERLMNSQFDLLIFDFVELMNCLVSFVSGKNSTISLKALIYLGKCADHLAEGKITPAAAEQQHISTDANNIAWEKSSSYEIKILNSGDSSVFRLWWPLMLGLSTRVGDTRYPVRSGALKTLHSVLHKYGHIFSIQTLSVIYKGVLFPMIDSAKTDNSQQIVSSYPSENPQPTFSRNSWIGSMAESVYSMCLEVHFLFGKHDTEGMLLTDLLNMLESCVCQDMEVLSRMAMKTISTLLLSPEEGDAPCVIQVNHAADLVTRKLCQIAKSNLCLSFGEFGELEYVADTPSYIRQTAIFGCPLNRRRQIKNRETSEKHSLRVLTAYGEGAVERIIPENLELKLPPRFEINLSFGAKLFCCSESEFKHIQEAKPSKNGRSWDQAKSSVMTSMVVELESIRIIGEVTLKHSHSFKKAHFQEFLSVLETLYWYARSFNANKELRRNLFESKFMKFPDDPNRTPNLLEQEVFSLSRILEISFRLYTSEGSGLSEFAEAWVHRITALTCERYLALEEGLASSTSTYDNEEHEAYGAAVLIALHGILDMNQVQFRGCFVWASTLLSKMILCDDVDVRSCISQIYQQHVHPLVVL